jgi:hypothetical protein
VVERGFVLAPGSRIGPLTAEERKAAMAGSLVAGVYEKLLDRESAYEKLKGDAKARKSAPATRRPGPCGRHGARPGAGRRRRPARRPRRHAVRQHRPARRQRDGLAQAMAKTVVRTIGSQVGREIVRGVLGSIMGGRRR